MKEMHIATLLKEDSPLSLMLNSLNLNETILVEYTRVSPTQTDPSLVQTILLTATEKLLTEYTNIHYSLSDWKYNTMFKGETIEKLLDMLCQLDNLSKVLPSEAEHNSMLDYNICTILEEIYGISPA